MKFALSTHWNARRHTTGETLVNEIRNLGIDQIELGYDLRQNLVPGIVDQVAKGVIQVTSVHNFCPIPPTTVIGDPELYTLASSTRKIREAALHYTSKTIRFAGELGSKIVVFHCGSVEMKNYTKRLFQLYRRGKRFSNQFEKTKFDLLKIREKKIPHHLNFLLDGLNRLRPALMETGIRLGLENPPFCEGIPNEPECQYLVQQLGKDCFCSWHDIGHAHIIENMGLFNHLNSLTSILPILGGMHVHDVSGGVCDHLMPPMGTIDFTWLRKFAQTNILRVLEPSPRLSFEQVKRGLAIIKEKWSNEPPISEEIN